MYGIGVHAFVSALGGREEKHLNPVRIVCRAGARSILVANISNQSNVVLLEKSSRLMMEILGDAIEKSSATRFDLADIIFCDLEKRTPQSTTATNAARYVA
jgi:hypothetical protein